MGRVPILLTSITDLGRGPEWPRVHPLAGAAHGAHRRRLRQPAATGLPAAARCEHNGQGLPAAAHRTGVSGVQGLLAAAHRTGVTGVQGLLAAAQGVFGAARQMPRSLRGGSGGFMICLRQKGTREENCHCLTTHP